MATSTRASGTTWAVERSWITPAACLPLIHVHKYSGLTELIEINMGHISYSFASLFIRQSSFRPVESKVCLHVLFHSCVSPGVDNELAAVGEQSCPGNTIPHCGCQGGQGAAISQGGGMSNSREKLNIKRDVTDMEQK